MSEHSIINYYKDKIQAAEEHLRHYSRLVNRYSFLRLFVIFAIILAIYKSVQTEKVFFTELSFLGGIVVFAYLVSKQAQFERKKTFYLNLKQVNNNEIDSITNQKNIYSNGSGFIDDTHVYTSDLDIFGKASLYNLLNRCATIHGNLRLSGWLKQKAATEEIVLRQQAIQELALQKEWLHDFKAKLLFAREDKENEVDKLLHYLQIPFESFYPWLKKYLALIPWAVISFLAAAYFYSIFFVPAVVVGLINVFFVFSNTSKVNKADRLIGKTGKVLYNYSEVFRLIEDQSFKAEYLTSLSLEVNKDKSSFHKKMKELSLIAGKMEYRLNIFVGPVLNFLFAWDVRQLIALENWKKQNSKNVQEAFDDLATFEALVSLASLHINYPSWVFPKVVDSKAYIYLANDLGHPLIVEEKRVLNDFQLKDESKVDIITGSNMAGKSTFLRTLGINAVLALAGAPVCASNMTISNFLIFTYMRIKDSLNESTSTFKAELNRLKLLLETLEANDKVYFMIDEMLRGTNSMDKYLGSKAVIEQLISKKAVGIVATHDLQIAKLEKKHPDYVRNFYFDIQIENNEMLFDYKIKQGECKTFNASILLKQLGIKFEAEEI